MLKTVATIYILVILPSILTMASFLSYRFTPVSFRTRHKQSHLSNNRKVIKQSNIFFFFCCVSINGCLRSHLSTLPYYVWYVLVLHCPQSCPMPNVAEPWHLFLTDSSLSLNLPLNYPPHRWFFFQFIESSVHAYRPTSGMLPACS